MKLSPEIVVLINIHLKTSFLFADSNSSHSCHSSVSHSLRFCDIIFMWQDRGEVLYLTHLFATRGFPTLSQLKEIFQPYYQDQWILKTTTNTSFIHCIFRIHNFLSRFSLKRRQQILVKFPPIVEIH